jgi:hypothetical protein
MIEAMKQALDLIVKSKRYAEECSHIATQSDCDQFDAVAENLRKAIQEEALRNVQRLGQEIEQEQVSYLGNGTAGRENMTAPTGFFFQMPKESQEPEAWNSGVPPLYPQIKDDETISVEYLETTQQPQRTWVGFTDEEREKHRDDWHSNIHDKEFKAIEAKLKEKNT